MCLPEPTARLASVWPTVISTALTRMRGLRFIHSSPRSFGGSVVVEKAEAPMPIETAPTPPTRRMGVLSIVQAETVTGPMKPLLMFNKCARRGAEGNAHVDQTLLTTVRGAQHQSGRPNLFLEAAAAAGIPVDIVIERFVFDYQVLPQIANYLAARAPQIIETHDFKSHFLLWSLKIRGQIGFARWIAFHHGYTKMSLKVMGYQQLDRLSLPAADRVITLCRPFVGQLISRGVSPEKIEVIANAVERRAKVSPEVVAKLRSSLGLQDGEQVILSVGRLSREKGHEVLISAFRQVCVDLNRDKFRLLIVGDGGEVEKLRRLAQDISDRVLFVGHAPDPWPFYHLGDVFVLPSISEGSPLVLFEAMSAGLPIVASAVGGIPEVVKDAESALLVRPGDVDQLATAL